MPLPTKAERLREARLLRQQIDDLQSRKHLLPDAEREWAFANGAWLALLWTIGQSDPPSSRVGKIGFMP